MSASTAILASLVIAYFGHLTYQGRKDILRFGPAMVAGIGIGLATVAFSALGRGYPLFGAVTNAGAAATFVLTAYAIWSRRHIYWRRADDARWARGEKTTPPSSP
jgi:heme A synthase